MRYLDLDALAATPAVSDPFEYVIVPGFVRRSSAALDQDFPRIEHPGSFPVETLHYGPAFSELLDELQGPDFEQAMERKLGVGLAGHPTMVTVRGRARARDGRIHTDTASKIVTVLVYLNDDWESQGGRLRLLRGPDDLEDMAAEVPPAWGNMLAFRRSEKSYHGHQPFEGERRVVQLNWVTSREVVEHELSRHRFSARMKRLNIFSRRDRSGDSG